VAIYQDTGGTILAESRDKGALAKGMRLTFEWQLVRLRCLTCGQAFPLQDDLTCPTCQMVGGDMVAEREFYMDSQVE
jgi:Zn finger protein HypA/HybF involved in hydrogenase expression